MEKLKIFRVLALAFVLLITTTTQLSVSAEASAHEPCVVSAYVFDGFNHWSLLRDNASLVGTELTIETSCEGEFDLIINGQPRQGGERLLSASLSLQTQRVEIAFHNWSVIYDNLTVYPAGDFTASLEQTYDIPDPITMSANSFEWSKVWIVLGSSVILWLLVTIVQWQIVNFYVDRFHCSEVTA